VVVSSDKHVHPHVLEHVLKLRKIMFHLRPAASLRGQRVTAIEWVVSEDDNPRHGISVGIGFLEILLHKQPLFTELINLQVRGMGVVEKRLVSIWELCKHIKTNKRLVPVCCKPMVKCGARGKRHNLEPRAGDEAK